jgi:hypothetical protein
VKGGFYDVISRCREIFRGKMLHARQQILDALFKKKVDSNSESDPQPSHSRNTQCYSLYIIYILKVILNKLIIVTIFGHPK